MSAAQIIQIETAALDAWRKRLDAARGDAIGSLLAFARVCYEFQQDCDAKQGGTVYTASMAEWFGIKHPASSQWATVGAHAQKLVGCNLQLPPSMETLYLLCEVPDNVIATKVTEKTTQKEARKLKREHAPKKSKPPKLFRIGWINLLVNCLGVTHGSLRDKREKIAAAIGAFPDYFTDQASADTFVAAYVKAFPSKLVQKPTLSETAQQKLDRAVALEKARLQGEHLKALYAEVDRRMPEFVAEREKQLEEWSEESKRYAILNRGYVKKISADEFRFLLQILHPDRAPEDRKEQYSRAFQIVLRLRDYAEA